MADVEQLVARLSLDMRQFRSEFQKAQGISAKSARDVENTWARTNAKLNGYGRSMAQGLIAPLTGIAAAASVREVAAYADAWTSAGNKLNAASQIAGRQARSLESLNQIANDTRTGISATTDLYAKLLRSTKDVASSEEEVARATTIINKAFKAGGAEAKEQAAGILQLSQALGSGITQGDELRSLRENAPLLAQAIADEFKTTIGGLKQLGADGELISARVFKAILNAQPKIEAAFAVTNQTIGDGVTKINNAFTQYIGQSDASLGATGRLVQGLNALADNFDYIADKTVQLAAIIAGALVGRSIAGMIVKLGLGTAAIYRFVAALSAARSVAGVATAIGGLGAVAGPVGLAVGTVLTGALIAFGTESGEASNQAGAYARALKEVEDAANKSGDAVEKASGKFVEERLNSLTKGAEDGTKAITAAKESASALFKEIIDNAPRRLVSAEQLKQLEELQAALGSGTMTAEQVHEALYALANSDPKFEKLAKQLDPLLKALNNAVDATAAVKKDLASLGGGLPDGRGQETAALAEARKTAKFLSDREAEAKRTEQQKKIDARTDVILAAADKAGAALTEAAARITAATEIAAEDLVASTEGGIKSFVDRAINAESGGNANAKNPNSTATGLGQFIESTWLDLFRKNFPDRAQELSRGAILALRTDSAVSRTLIEAYARENAAILQSAGVSVDEVALQLAHFLGPDGAVKVLTAAPGTKIQGLLGQAAINANPTILGNGATVESVRAYGEKRAGVNTRAASALNQREESDQAFAKKLEEQRQYIAALQAETGIRATLNPLVNDYGQAMTAVQIAQELLTAAQKEGVAAGLELKDVQQLLYGDLSGLSPVARDQALAMRELALSQGEAEAAGNRLEESQKNLQETLRQSSAFGKDVLGGFIRDLRDGKSATEALANALGKVADKLLDMALNSLFDGAGGGGGGPLGSLFSFLFNAKGGIVQDGKRLPMMAKGGITKSIAIAGEAGPEAIVPLPDGKRIPVVLSQPMGPTGRQGGSNDVVTLTLQDDSGRMADIANQQIRTSAGTIVNIAVQQSRRAVKADMPNLINGAQTRQM